MSSTDTNDTNDTKKPIIITLFYSHACSYCDEFDPVWKQMEKDPEATQNIEFSRIEASEIDSLIPELRTVEGKDVREFGYPAIKITINGEDYVYLGRRKPEEIYRFILEIISTTGDDVVVKKTTDNDEAYITISTQDKDIKDAVKEMNGGGDKQIFKRVSNDHFKFMNQSYGYSEVAKFV